MTKQRTELLRERIVNALHPQSLEIEDQGHLHAGHAAAREGLGHFRVRVIARQFDGLLPLQRHRLIYQAVGDLMQTEIHALTIEALSPGELSQ